MGDEENNVLLCTSRMPDTARELQKVWSSVQLRIGFRMVTGVHVGSMMDEASGSHEESSQIQARQACACSPVDQTRR